MFDIPHRFMEQPGRPSRLYTANYIRKADEQFAAGYNTIIMADYQKQKSITYHFPFSVGGPLTFTNNYAVVCDTLRSDSIVCLNEHGEEQWKFAPDLEKPTQRLTFVRTDREEIILRSDYGSKEAVDRIWRISPENGQIMTERVLPAEEHLSGFRWLPDMACFIYYVISSNSVVILDQDFKELRRFQLGEKYIRFDTGFYSGHFGYTPVPQLDDTWYLIQIDLITGKLTEINPELPVFINQILSDGTFVCVTDENMKSLNLCDHDGKLISRHRFKDCYRGLWEEDGQIFVMTFRPSSLPGLWEDSQIDTVKIFRLVDTSVNE